MKKMISPSLMCADMLHLGNVLQILEKTGTDYLHIDIMDGHFVPNFTLGTDLCRLLKANCRIPLDIHLMVERPEEKLDWFPFGSGDIVSVHAEATPHLQKALASIRERGAKPFAALNPATPLSALEYVTDEADGVLLMAVNPGFAGQKMIPTVLQKITQLRKNLDRCGKKDTLIEVDGNVSFENAEKMSKAGADIFVAGTSSVFSMDMTPEAGITKLRSILD